MSHLRSELECDATYPPILQLQVQAIVELTNGIVDAANSGIQVSVAVHNTHKAPWDFSSLCPFLVQVLSLK